MSEPTLGLPERILLVDDNPAIHEVSKLFENVPVPTQMKMSPFPEFMF